LSLGARLRTRPAAYPAAILVALVLNLLVDSAVSPYAIGRPLIAAIAIGFLAPWLAGLVSGDRDRAGMIGLLAVLSVLAGRMPAVTALSLIAVALLGLHLVLAPRAGPEAQRSHHLMAMSTRSLTMAAAILLVAVAIKAVQLDRIGMFAQDLLAESPLRPQPIAANQVAAKMPNLVLVLLDGFPRSDKLQSEFGIDDSSFVRELRTRDFFVAEHSRSNQTLTQLTLAQMFNYQSADWIASRLDRASPTWRLAINDSLLLRDLHQLGYRTVAVAPGFENVALRRADVYLDTGQLNEFEWAIGEMTGIGSLASIVLPNLAADERRSRLTDAFEVAQQEARRLRDGRTFLFVHVVAPHSPQVFGADGQPLELDGFVLPYADTAEIARFGIAEYRRRLAGQITFLEHRTLQLVDSVVANDPGAVVVVFSDHGSGAPPRRSSETYPYPELRTANLLAVRSPARPGIIDDRSTLANLLPRLLRAYTGSGPADVPETIFAWSGNWGTSFFFDRPD